MPRYWVDIESSAGTRLGSGPIISLTDWTFTARLDAAGSFSFTMPRDDPKADLLQQKRIARCWTYDVNGGKTELGSGIINEVRTYVESTGRAMVSVSGDSRLAELSTRIIRQDTFDEDEYIHPAEVTFAGAQALDVYDLAVGDTTTFVAHAGGGDAIDIYAPYKFNRIDFVLSSSSVTTGAGKIAYFDADSNAIEFQTALSFVNTTAVAGAWFAQSGYMSWDMDAVSGWELEMGTGGPGGVGPQYINYHIRIWPDGLWDDFSVSDISLRHTVPTNDALTTIMSYAPSGWDFDSTGYDENQTRPLGSELLSNPGFETYTAGTPPTFNSWTNSTAGGGVISAAGSAHGGSTCVQLYTDDSEFDYAIVRQTVACSPATEYTLTFWTKSDSAARGGQFGVSDAGRSGNPQSTIIGWTDTMLVGGTWQQYSVTFTTPTYTNSLKINLSSPLDTTKTAWFDDVSLKTGGGNAISLDALGETVLENLIRVAETTGEHFVESTTTKQVLWLGNDRRDSGMRAIAHADPIAIEDNSDVCLIQSLSEVETGTDLISRVYPYGGGAEPAPTLRECTRVAPTGYTLDKTNNYLRNDAAEALYGQIERRLDCPDITNISGDAQGDIHGSNMLFDRSYAYLKRRIATDLSLDGDAPRTYDLALLKCDARLLPGYTLHIEYSRWMGGVQTMDIDDDYWIVSSTIRADNNGVRTTNVTCSTVDAVPMSDDLLIVDMLRKQRRLLAQ